MRHNKAIDSSLVQLPLSRPVAQTTITSYTRYPLIRSILSSLKAVSRYDKCVVMCKRAHGHWSFRDSICSCYKWFFTSNFQLLSSYITESIAHNYSELQSVLVQTDAELTERMICWSGQQGQHIKLAFTIFRSLTGWSIARWDLGRVCTYLYHCKTLIAIRCAVLPLLIYGHIGLHIVIRPELHFDGVSWVEM